MKTSKKITVLLLTIVFACLCFTACSDASDDPVVGVWEMSSISIDDVDMSAEDYIKSAELDSAPTLTFEGDGSVTLNNGEQSGTSRWTNKDGVYSVTDNSGDKPVAMEFKIDGNQLTMEQNSYKLTYEKKQ